MKRIHYASGSLLTGDAIADVLVRFGAALAHRNDAAEVHVPVVVQGGDTGEALMLLGPASQILAEDEQVDGPELQDDGFVSDVEGKIAALGPVHATYVQHGTDDMPDIDYDLL